MKTTSLITKTVRYTALCLFAMVSILPALRAADGNPPEKLTYQGYLVDATGSPLGATAPKNYDVIFRIYNHETASGASYRLWTEVQTVTADKGYFSLVLGEGGSYGTEARPAISTLFTNVDASDRYIEMTVRGVGAGGADSTILPRLRLLPTPYSLLAKTAVNAKNLMNSVGGQVVTLLGTNVGINRAIPGTALDVNGTISASTANVSGSVTVGGNVTANGVTGTTVTGTTVNGSTITASSGFVGPGSVPVGTIVLWSGTSIPTGWAICDGRTVNGQATPDLRGRFVLGSGAGSGLTARTLNTTGGEENHTLSAAEMPSHSHGVSDPSHSHGVNDPSHSHGLNGSADGWNNGNAKITDRGGASGNTSSAYTGISIRSATTGVSINSTGGSGAHNTMPPFYVLAYIMRVH
ncbi:MAG: tail fiber protein [Verrucomicrobiota bacterium]